jgi:serine phosphatase RsbU (regulator of sigma subunit)
MTTVYPEEDGVVWFGGVNGIIRFDAQVEMNYAVAYPALVRRVVVGADSVLFGGTVPAGMAAPVLAYAYNHLRFAYAASSYEDARRLHFQTWLEGFDDGWSDWNDKTEKEYTNLPEGRYQFRVRARNGYDHLSQEAVFAFTILPPWWRTWWAYTLYGLLLGGAVFAVDRVQRRRLLRKERERASLREREIRAKSLLHEKELRAESAEHLANYLQAENKRQTQELEQARQLQLSMLPRTLPIHPTVELAAYMKTATEVGGDYYDADLAEDGTLTLVIGDATGHGLPAGTMVTATKGILGALARQDDLGQVLQTASEAVRRMRLPRLYMALALVRLRGHTLEVAGAGMPPAMVYRAATGGIDVVPLKGMPLGSPSRYPYRVQGVSLSAGDTVLLMSDGLPELRSVTGELLGYERMPELLAGMGGLRAEEVIACVLEAAKAWCEGTAPDDDLTLIVMKVKAPPANGHQGLLTREADRDA